MNNVFLVAFVLLSFAACAQSKSTGMEENKKSDEAAVIATVRQLAMLMIEKDTVAMSNILDEHYSLTHITGFVQPRKEWFSEVLRESMKYYSVKEVESIVKVNGYKANVIVQDLVDARIWGSRNTWRLQQKMQLEKRNGK